MSWEENKEFTESKPQYQPDPPEPYSLWKKTWKYVVVGVVCFLFGLSVTTCRAESVAERNRNLSAENRKLKKSIQTIEEAPAETVLVPYTVLVPVTESIETSKSPAPTTDVPATETKAAEKETAAAESEDNSDRIREITNPLTKIPPYKVKPPAPAQYTIYWLDVERSDLAEMTADDFAFFTNYINEKYNTDDNVYFYVRLTDYPDVIFEFFIPTYGMMTANIGISKEDTDDHCYRIEYNSCYMDFDDPSQIKLTGIKKDEYKLPVEDEDEIYYFSEFNEDMFNQIQKFQEHAKFLWG